MKRALLVVVVAIAAAQTVNLRAAESNYKLIENWAQLPEGMKWGSMSAVDVDYRNGTVYVFERGEHENAPRNPSGMNLGIHDDYTHSSRPLRITASKRSF